mgnify:CR=1 FL=1
MGERTWRPIHRRLQPVDGMPEFYNFLPVHMALVTDDDPQQFRTACDGGLGEWITGDVEQVTCLACQDGGPNIEDLMAKATTAALDEWVRKTMEDG